MKPITVTIIQIVIAPKNDAHGEKIYGLGDDQKVYKYKSGEWELV